MANDLEFGIALKVDASLANIALLENRIKDLESTIKSVNKRSVNVGGSGKSIPSAGGVDKNEAPALKQINSLIKEQGEAYKALELQRKRFVATSGKAGLSNAKFFEESTKLASQFDNEILGILDKFDKLPKSISNAVKSYENKSLGIGIKAEELVNKDLAKSDLEFQKEFNKELAKFQKEESDFNKENIKLQAEEAELIKRKRIERRKDAEIAFKRFDNKGQQDSAEKEAIALEELKRAGDKVSLAYRKLELEQKRFIATSGKAGLSNAKFFEESTKLASQFDNEILGILDKFDKLPKSISNAVKSYENKSLGIGLKAEELVNKDLAKSDLEFQKENIRLQKEELDLIKRKGIERRKDAEIAFKRFENKGQQDTAEREERKQQLRNAIYGRAKEKEANAIDVLRRASQEATLEYRRLELEQKRFIKTNGLAGISSKQFAIELQAVADRLKNVTDGVKSEFKNLPKDIDLLTKRLNNQSTDIGLDATKQKGGLKNFLARGFAKEVAGYGVAGDALSASLIGMSTGATVALAGVATGAVALGVALVEATQRALAFEREMVKVAKTTGLSEQSMNELEGSLLGIASSTGFAKEGLAKIAENAGSQGIEGAENIAVYTEAIAKLASVSDLSADEASANVGRLLSVFQLDPSEASSIGSTLNDIADSYNATEAGIVQFAARVAPTTKQLGLSVDETIAFGGILVSAIGSWEIASSSLNTLLTNLVGELPKVAKIAGITAEEFQNLKASSPKEALQLFFDGLNKLDKVNKEKAVIDIFGQGQDARTALILADAYSKVAGKTLDMNEAFAQAKKAKEEDISLNTAMGRVLDSTSGKIDVFTARWDAFLTALGKPIVGVIGDILGGINGLFDTTEDDMNQFISKIGKTKSSLKEIGVAQEGIADIRNLVSEYDSLFNVKERTTEQDERLNEVTDELAKKFPQFISGYDQAGKATGVFTDEIIRAISAQEELLRLQSKSFQKEELGQFRESFGVADGISQELEEAKSYLEQLEANRDRLVRTIATLDGTEDNLYVSSLNTQLQNLNGTIPQVEANVASLSGTFGIAKSTSQLLADNLRKIYGSAIEDGVTDVEKAVALLAVALNLSQEDARNLFNELEKFNGAKFSAEVDFTVNLPPLLKKMLLNNPLNKKGDPFDTFGLFGKPEEIGTVASDSDKKDKDKNNEGSSNTQITTSAEQRRINEANNNADRARENARRIAEQANRERLAREKRELDNKQAYNKFLTDLVDESFDIQLEASRRDNPYLDDIDTEIDEYLKKKRDLNRELTQELYATIDKDGNGKDFKEGLGKDDLAEGQSRINQALANYASLRDVDIADVLKEQAKEVDEQIADIAESFLDLEQTMNGLRGLDEIPFFSEMDSQNQELKELEKRLSEANKTIAEGQKAITDTDDAKIQAFYQGIIDNETRLKDSVVDKIAKIKEYGKELIKLQLIENKRIALRNQEAIASATLGLLDAQEVGDTPERTARVNELRESLESQLELNVNEIVSLENGKNAEKSQQRINDLKQQQLDIQIRLLAISKQDFAYGKKIEALIKTGTEVSDNALGVAISQKDTLIASETDPEVKKRLIKERSGLETIQKKRQAKSARQALTPVEKFATDFIEYGTIVADVMGDVASAWESSIRRRQQAEDDLLETLLANGQITEDEAERRRKQNEDIAKEEFARYKKFAIAQALIQGSVAVLGALGDLTIPITTARIAQAAGIAIATGIQVAQIRRQEYWKGGLVEGQGYANGRDTVPASLTKKEYVTPVSATKEHLPFLEAMRDGKTKEELANMYLPYLDSKSFIPRQPAELEMLYSGGTLNQKVSMSTKGLEEKINVLTSTLSEQSSLIEKLMKEQNSYIQQNKPKAINGADALNLMGLAKSELKKRNPKG